MFLSRARGNILFFDLEEDLSLSDPQQRPPKSTFSYGILNPKKGAKLILLFLCCQEIGKWGPKLTGSVLSGRGACYLPSYRQ